MVDSSPHADSVMTRRLASIDRARALLLNDLEVGTPPVVARNAELGLHFSALRFFARHLAFASAAA